MAATAKEIEDYIRERTELPRNILDEDEAVDFIEDAASPFGVERKLIREIFGPWEKGTFTRWYYDGIARLAKYIESAVPGTDWVRNAAKF